MKLRIRKDLCCGAQLCTHVAPDLFRLDALGYNVSDGDEVPAGDEELAKQAARSCPEGAISLDRRQDNG
jgi:ferredoxin